MTLADAVWHFLERALEERAPERDVPASKVLCRRIIDEWPADVECWVRARESLTKALCEKLVEQPQIWARAIDLIYLYINRIELIAPHPLQTDTKPVHRGQRVYVVEFGLALALTTGLLSESTREMRAQLYDALDTWESWQTVAEALAAHPLPFEGDEILRLLERATRFSEGDMAAGLLFDTLLEGLRASTTIVDALLKSWFGRMDIEPKVVGLLALWRLPQDNELGELRQQLVHQFLRLPPQHGARMAVHIAYRSWPTSTTFEPRRAALVDCIDRLGAEGLAPALAALSHDNNIQLEQAIALHDSIVARIDVANQNDPMLASQRVEVLYWLTDKEPSLDVATLVARLPPALAFPADEHRLRLLDWLLSRLATREAAPVQAYLLDWIEAQAGAFRFRGLTQLLPSTSKLLSGARWLIEAATSRRPALRIGALGCLIHAQRPAPADFASLRETQVLALAHLMLAEADLGATIIDLIFALARARIDCIVALTPLLGEEALRTYPGQCERSIASWADAVADRTEDDVERRTVTQLQGLLDARKQTYEAKSTLFETIFERSSPTKRTANEWLERAFHHGLGQSNSLFLQIATKIPMACGAGWALDTRDADSGTARPFKKVSHEVEVPDLGGYDPIASTYSRFVHQQQADRLLNAGEEQAP